jgi:hypothetical protein
MSSLSVLCAESKPKIFYVTTGPVAATDVPQRLANKQKQSEVDFVA